MIQDLYETHILVSNLERSRHFYEELLGLEVGWINEGERRLLYWVGGRGKAMLGMREVPAEKVAWQHFAFEVRLTDMEQAVAFLKERGIKCHNKVDGSESPQVFGWMPAAAIYFNDPDGHLLEFISMLPDKPRPELGQVLWDEWKQRPTR
jgi:catechol 2,3-dioxygenase-like lactoylglutathione lyase family enzyme